MFMDNVYMRLKGKKTHIGTIKGVDAAKASKPYFVVRFKTGAHVTPKDKPRNKNWRNWKEDM